MIKTLGVDTSRMVGGLLPRVYIKNNIKIKCSNTTLILYATLRQKSIVFKNFLLFFNILRCFNVFDKLYHVMYNNIREVDILLTSYFYSRPLFAVVGGVFI